jgi:hypothetical protein
MLNIVDEYGVIINEEETKNKKHRFNIRAKSPNA